VCAVKLFAIALIGCVWPAPPELACCPAFAVDRRFYAVVVLMPWATAFANLGGVAPEQRRRPGPRRAAVVSSSRKRIRRYEHVLDPRTSLHG